MDLIQTSHAKQIVGIILVVVFLLTVCVSGSRDHRESNRRAAIKTVLAENTTAQAETETVR